MSFTTHVWAEVGFTAFEIKIIEKVNDITNKIKSIKQQDLENLSQRESSKFSHFILLGSSTFLEILIS